MKTYGGVNVEIHIFLVSELVGGEWSESRSSRFTSGGRAPGNHWIWDWVGNSSVVQPAASRYTDSATATPHVCMEYS
jgi:hypothetical protein